MKAVKTGKLFFFSSDRHLLPFTPFYGRTQKRRREGGRGAGHHSFRMEEDGKKSPARLQQKTLKVSIEGGCSFRGEHPKSKKYKRSLGKKRNFL